MREDDFANTLADYYSTLSVPTGRVSIAKLLVAHFLAVAGRELPFANTPPVDKGDVYQAKQSSVRPLGTNGPVPAEKSRLCADRGVKKPVPTRAHR